MTRMSPSIIVRAFEAVLFVALCASSVPATVGSVKPILCVLDPEPIRFDSLAPT